MRVINSAPDFWIRYARLHTPMKAFCITLFIVYFSGIYRGLITALAFDLACVALAGYIAITAPPNIPKRSRRFLRLFVQNMTKISLPPARTHATRSTRIT
jgi:hypothetical protein